jgi:hypothetical protein
VFFKIVARRVGPRLTRGPSGTGVALAVARTAGGRSELDLHSRADVTALWPDG